MSSYTDDWWEGCIHCLTEAQEVAKSISPEVAEIVDDVLLEAFDRIERKSREDLWDVPDPKDIVQLQGIQRFSARRRTRE